MARREMTIFVSAWYVSPSEGWTSSRNPTTGSLFSVIPVSQIFRTVAGAETPVRCSCRAWETPLMRLITPQPDSAVSDATSPTAPTVWILMDTDCLIGTTGRCATAHSGRVCLRHRRSAYWRLTFLPTKADVPQRAHAPRPLRDHRAPGCGWNGRGLSRSRHADRAGSRAEGPARFMLR